MELAGWPKVTGIIAESGLDQGRMRELELAMRAIKCVDWDFPDVYNRPGADIGLGVLRRNCRLMANTNWRVTELEHYVDDINWLTVDDAFRAYSLATLYAAKTHYGLETSTVA